jgi:hypothetical protein
MQSTCVSLRHCEPLAAKQSRKIKQLKSDNA